MSNEKPIIAVTALQKRTIPVLLAIVIFMQMLDATILNTALPTIAEDFGISPLSMQSVIISYTLALALFTPLSAFLADKMGTKSIFLWAIILFTLGSFMGSMSQHLNMLVLGRIIQGVGGAFLTPVMRLTLVKVYPKNELVPVLNYAIMPALIGPMIGPALGGYIVEIASWQWIFLMNIPIGIFTFIAGFFLMPAIRDHATRFDISGFLRFSSGLFLLIYGLDQLAKGDGLLKSLLLLFAGATLIFSYWQYAKRRKFALFPTKLWLIRTYRIGFSGNLIARIGMSAIPFLLPLYLQLTKGYSPAQSGALLIPFAIAGILTKPFIASILGRFGYRRTLLTNTCLMGIMLLLIAASSYYLTTPLLIVLFFVTGILNSLQFSAMNSLTLAKLRASLVSSGSTLMFVNQQFSLSLGVAITMTLLNYTTQLFPNMSLSGQFQWVFLVIGLITLASMMVFSRLQRSDGNELL